MLSVDQMDELLEKITERMLVANRSGTLFDLLSQIGWSDLLSQNEDSFTNFKHGFIYVLGDSEVKENKLIGAAKDLGISRGRIKIFSEYAKLKHFDFRGLRYNSQCAAILVGPMPHSTPGTSDYGSAIEAMCAPGSGYPPVLRLRASNELKITKNAFIEGIKQLLNDGIICVG